MDIPSAEPAGPSVLAAEPITYSDRSTGLTVFGIILIVLGLLSALMIPFTLPGIFMARKTGGAMPPGSYVLSISMYTSSTAALIVLGIGSIRAQRWARNLILIASWLWLVYGSISIVTITAILPSSLMAGFRSAAAKNPQAPQLPAGVMAVILTLMIALVAVFMVVLPIIFVVFYRRKDVEETCKRRDPLPSWTEKAPLPVLAVSIICVIGALYYLGASFAVPMFPFFGKYLTGLPASAALLMLAVLDGFLAFSLFKRQIIGWWIAVIALILRGIALALTVHRGNLVDAYARMGWSTRQLELMQNTGLYRSGGILWLGMAFLVLFLGYLIWIKRYFSADLQAASTLTLPEDMPSAS